ncbi:aspartate/glutamate racemase family protein [Streptomyces sp. NBC_01304]|uniref:aspartate/glutamate racemase family protein n=1 Tax=Streptomyces sp. NBC_01304 TaxID=2903818 RepID=UPI002E12FF3F|nr:aspartate/glutamate racemase family protein [Streptomyces sp. NBC_01304]
MHGKRTVVLINPNTSPDTTAMLAAAARTAFGSRGAFEVRAVTAAAGPRMIVTPEELRASAAQVLAAALRAGPQGVAAFVVGAFGDPGVEELRTVVPVPVVGIGEAALVEAAHTRFGVVTTTPALARPIAARIEVLGLADRCTGVRCTEGDPETLSSRPDILRERLAAAVESSVVRDGAHAVVIGGGPLTRAGAALQERFAVPVIVPVAAACRRIEQLLG